EPNASSWIRACRSSSRVNARTKTNSAISAGTAGSAAMEYRHAGTGLAWTNVIAPTSIIRYASTASPKLICERYVTHDDCVAGGSGACGGGPANTGSGASVLLKGEAASAKGVSSGWLALSEGTGWADTTIGKLTRRRRQPEIS